MSIAGNHRRNRQWRVAHADINLDPLDRPIYGATAIGRVMGLKPRQAFHALENGYLDADKFGGRWMSTPRRLRRIAEGRKDKPLDAA